MQPRHLFPLGKAYGDAFCNREEETERLLGNIKNAKHTLIIANLFREHPLTFIKHV